MAFDLIVEKLVTASWKVVLSASVSLIAGEFIQGAMVLGRPLEGNLLYGVQGLIYLVILGVSYAAEKAFTKHWKKIEIKETVEEKEKEEERSVVVKRSALEERLLNLSDSEKKLLGYMTKKKVSHAQVSRKSLAVNEAVVTLQKDKILTLNITTPDQYSLNITLEVMAHLFKNEHLVDVNQTEVVPYIRPKRESRII